MLQPARPCRPRSAATISPRPGRRHVRAPRRLPWLAPLLVGTLFAAEPGAGNRAAVAAAGPHRHAFKQDSAGSHGRTPSAAPTEAVSAPRHLALFFSYQRIGLNRFNRAHTFATFARVVEGASGRQVESETISWYPGEGKGHPRELLSRPELRALEGRNQSLAETLEDARTGRCRVTMWGPFEIKAELFERARRQARRLETEGCQWQALDRRHRLNCQAFNCIHAVSDLDLGAGLLRTHVLLGESATRKVVSHLRPWLVGCPADSDWLIDHLGVRCESLEREPRGLPPRVRLDYDPVPCCWRRQVPFRLGINPTETSLVEPGPANGGMQSPP